MPVNRKLLGAAAFSLALAGGGAAGALLGTPTSSGAQDEPTTEATAPAGAPMDHDGAGLTAAADAIGISEADLRTALEGGQSIAQVAADHDVKAQTVIDAMVAAATDELDAAIDELPARITDLVNREGLPSHGDHGPGGPGGRGGPDGGFGGPGLGFDAAAEAIGISTADLQSALQGGSTIAEVAADHDVDVQTVVDALVAEATTRIEAAVTDGQLTEDEAAERTADLTDHITAMVNGEMGRGPGRFGPPAAADATSPTT